MINDQERILIDFCHDKQDKQIAKSEVALS